MISPTVIYGIDFSGSHSPEKKIWITEATTRNGNLTIERSTSAKDWFEVTGRDAVLESLREFIRTQGSAVFGLDFPFGFPASVVEAESWTGFLEAFATTFAGETIDAFPGHYGKDGRMKRDLDYRHAGQSPMSPQIKYQVFYGLRDLLWPLVNNTEVAVLPMHSPKTGTPRLIEVYPAATFGRLGLYRTGYKQSRGAARRREENIHELAAHGVEIPDESITNAIESDDALDSICAAFATWRALQDGLEQHEPTVEGHRYCCVNQPENEYRTETRKSGQKGVLSTANRQIAITEPIGVVKRESDRTNRD